MRQKVFCENCRKDVGFEIKPIKVKSRIKGKAYEYSGKVAHCLECNSEVYLPEINDYNLDQLYKERKKIQRKTDEIPNTKMLTIDPSEKRSKEVTNTSLAGIENSFIAEDFNGLYLRKYQTDLKESGFDINVINFTKEDLKSLKYNPFVYVENEEDAYLLAESIITNTKVVNNETNPCDEFWKEGEKRLLECAITNECLVKKGSNMSFRQIISSLKNEKEIKDIIKRNRALKSLGPQTLGLIIKNCIIRLSSLSVLDENIRYEANDVDLRAILDNKSATFIVYPVGTQFYKALTNMMYSQLYNEAVKKKESGKKMSPLTLFINEKSDSYKINSLTMMLVNAANLNLGISLNTNNVESFLDKYQLRTFLSVFDQLIVFKNEMSDKTAKEIQEYVVSNFEGKIFDPYKKERVELTTDDLKNIREDETIFLNRENKIALKYKI